MFYVYANDKFMSYWGKAQNKISKYIIICETQEEAFYAEQYLKKREEMKYVKVSKSGPTLKHYHYPSWKKWSNLQKRPIAEHLFTM